MNKRVARSFLVVSVLGGMLTAAAPPAQAAPTCFGKRATVVGTNGPDTLEGTAGSDVIAGLGGNDDMYGFGGPDLICGAT